MIFSPETNRVPLHNGVAHVVAGRLHLRRFRSDHGATDFIMRSAKAVEELVDLGAELSQEGSQMTEPNCRPLADDYVVYWAPGKNSSPASLTLALEPFGLPTEIPPFRLTLTELMRIAAIVRATLDDTAK
jgi:hypothetical protein